MHVLAKRRGIILQWGQTIEKCAQVANFELRFDTDRRNACNHTLVAFEVHTNTARNHLVHQCRQITLGVANGNSLHNEHLERTLQPISLQLYLVRECKYSVILPWKRPRQQLREESKNGKVQS